MFRVTLCGARYCWILFILLSLSGGLSSSSHAANVTFQIIPYDTGEGDYGSNGVGQTKGYIPNPSRGDFRWGWQDNQGYDYGWFDTKGIPSGRVFHDDYKRFVWRALEKNPNQYDFSVLEYHLAQAKLRGRRFGTRIMIMSEYEGDVDGDGNTDGLNGAPQYIENWGLGRRVQSSKSECNNMFVPYWNHPTFIARVEALFNALGAQFDGDPRLSYLDIGIYGHWGEWHMSMNILPRVTDDINATAATRAKFIDIVNTAFKRTRLMLMPDVDGDFPERSGSGFSYAMARYPRMGVRKDNLSNDWFEQEVSNWYPNIQAAFTDRWKTTPFMCEFFGGEDGAALLRAERQVIQYHVSTVACNQWCIDAQRIEIGKAAGYRYQLNQVIYPDSITAGHTFNITSRWSNVGVAPVYEDWAPIWELYSGSTLVWSCRSSLDLQQLLPTTTPDDDVNTEETEANGKNTPVQVSDTLAVPASLTPGTYTLKLVVLHQMPGSYLPPMALATQGRDVNGRYPVGTLTVQAPSVQAPNVTLSPLIEPPYVGEQQLITPTVVAGSYPVQNVTLLVNGSVVDTDTSAPWSLSWTPTSAHVYVLQAKATDTQGNSSVSAPLTVEVERAPNSPPSVTLAVSAGPYTAPATVTLHATASDSDGIAKVEFYNGITLIANVTSPPYTTNTTLGSGVHTLSAKAYDTKGAFAYAYKDVTVQSLPKRPYPDPNTIPLITSQIEMENYDTGGEGVSWHDTSSANEGGKYRSDSVDIQNCGDTGGGYNLGWMNSGEWLEYTVRVEDRGVYKVKLRLASPPNQNPGPKVTFTVNNATILGGEQELPKTGRWDWDFENWQTWTSTPTVTLAPGIHVVRMTYNSGMANFNWMQFEYQSSDSTYPSAAPTNLTATAANATAINLSWQESCTNESGFKIERSENDGYGFEGIATVGSNVTSYQATNLTTGKTYYFRVRAYNGAGHSGYSNQASAAPTAQSCVVTFDPTGGSEPNPSSKIVIVGGTYGTLPATARDGYSWNGWFTASSGGSQVTANTTVTNSSNHTLYAQWTLNTYNVTYLANNATSGNPPATQTKTHGVDLTLATNTGNLQKSGYYFAGWNTASDGSGVNYAPGQTYTQNAALTLYAKWAAQPTYTVMYHANGATSGTPPASQTKTHNVTLTLATNTGHLAKTGYSFGGWNTAADGSGTTYAAGGSYAENANVTLYAKWISTGPVATISPVNVTISETGSGTNLTVTLSEAPSNSLNITYSVAGTATAGSDYQTLSGVVTIPAGQTSANITITPIDDSDVESDETVILTLTSGEGYSIGSPSQATVTITSDEAAVLTLSLDPGTISEEGGVAVGTVTRNTPVGSALVVNLASSHSSQAVVPANVTIAAGSVNATFNVTAVDDSLVDGTVVVTITASATGYQSGQAGLNVTDDAVNVTLEASAGGSVSPSGSIGVDPDASTSILATPNAGYYFVDWRVVSGNAMLGNATMANTTVTQASAGAVIRGNFAINTYTLTYSAGNGGSISGNTSQVVNHGADGTPVTAVPDAGYHFVKWSDDVTANPRTDTNVTSNLTVTASFAPITYHITASAGPNGSISPSGQVSVNHGASQSFTITPNTGYHVADVLIDGSSVGAVSSYTFTNVTSDGSIAASFAINEYTVTFDLAGKGTRTGGGELTQTVSHGSSAVAPTVQANSGWIFTGWSPSFTSVTSNLTVTAQYVSSTHTVTFDLAGKGTRTGGGELTQTVSHGGSAVAPTVQANPGYLFVGWSTSFDYVTGDLTVVAQYTVANVGVLQFASTSLEVNEGVGTVTVRVERVGGTSGQVSVEYGTSDGTATVGSDYRSASGTLTWADGDSSARTIVVTIVNDAVCEPNETLSVMLWNPAGGATLGNTSATVTILDDDAAPVATVVASDPSVGEAAGGGASNGGAVTITLSKASAFPVTVSYKLGGTAGLGSDYTVSPSGGSVTFAAEETSKTITVTPIDDDVYEGNETVILTLNAGVGYTVGSAASAVVTIVDNETAPVKPAVVLLQTTVVNTNIAITSAIAAAQTLGSTAPVVNLTVTQGVQPIWYNPAVMPVISTVVTQGVQPVWYNPAVSPSLVNTTVTRGVEPIRPVRPPQSILRPPVIQPLNRRPVIVTPGRR